MLFHTSTPYILHKKCASWIPQYPTFFTNCKTLPTIPSILHKLQNLAAIPPLTPIQDLPKERYAFAIPHITPIQDLPKERYAFAIPHNTQHSSQMVKALLPIPHQYGILQKQQKPCCYSRATQYLTFFTKNLIAIPTTPNIVAIPHPHCNSDNTQYSSQIAKPCHYSTNIQYKDLTQQRYEISAYRKDIHFAGQMLKTVIKSPMMLQ
jgi:hypothetical protein